MMSASESPVRTPSSGSGAVSGADEFLQLWVQVRQSNKILLELKYCTQTGTVNWLVAECFARGLWVKTNSKY